MTVQTKLRLTGILLWMFVGALTTITNPLIGWCTLAGGTSFLLALIVDETA